MSVEFLMITAFAFLLIIPVLLLFLTEAQDINDDVTAIQVKKLSEELLDSVNNVYYLGAPTKKTFNIYIPQNVVSASFEENRIMLSVDTGASTYAVVKFAATNVTGSLNTNSGRHSIEVTAEADSVRIEG